MNDSPLVWELAEQLMQHDPRVVESTMMGGRCLRVGKEFLALAGFKDAGLVVKLTPARVTELIEAGHGRPFAPAGKVFKAWVSVPEPDPDLWLQLLHEGAALNG